MTTKAERTAWFFERMTKLGFTPDEAMKLRRIEMTLQRWSELECGDSNEYASWAIERDDETGRPFMVRIPHQNGETIRRTPIADREAGALKRLAAIMARHPKLWYYHQSDPRGCALYIGRKGDLPKNYFEVVPRYPEGWTIQNKFQPGLPYACNITTKREAKAFARRETLSTLYTRGVAVRI